MEDTPTAIIEAQSVGLPVISTYHAGIPEIVKNNSTGLLIPEKNDVELQNALKYFMDNPLEIEKMGIQARKFIEENFNLDKEITKLEKIYSL